MVTHLLHLRNRHAERATLALTRGSGADLSAMRFGNFSGDIKTEAGAADRLLYAIITNKFVKEIWNKRGRNTKTGIRNRNGRHTCAFGEFYEHKSGGRILDRVVGKVLDPLFQFFRIGVHRDFFAGSDKGKFQFLRFSKRTQEINDI